MFIKMLTFNNKMSTKGAIMFMDFKEISKVPFRQVLDHLGIVYEETADNIKGLLKNTPFIVTISKNMFLCPYNKEWKGGVINFVSINNDIPLVEGAKLIKEKLIDRPVEPKRDIPELKLEYCSALRLAGVNQETATALEIGLCKQKSIMAGKVCFRMYGDTPVGYIGYKDGKWIFPKAYKNDYLFNYHRLSPDFDFVIVAPNPLACALYYSNGVHQVVGMTSECLTEEQEKLFCKFDRVALIDPHPSTLMRLSKHCFVRQGEFPEILSYL